MKICNRLFLDEGGELVYDPTVEPIQRSYLRTNIVTNKSDVVTFLFKNEEAFASAMNRWNQSTKTYTFSALSGYKD